MTRLVLIERGQTLTSDTLDALAGAAPVAARLVEDAPPFREGQILHLRRAAGAAAGPVLRRRDGALHLDPGGGTGEVVARVVGVTRGPTTLWLERAPARWVPGRWVPRVVDALEVLGRLRRPLTPPLFQGPAGACLAAVRAKYDHPGEVGQYARLALAEPEPYELGIIRRHVPAGGRLLDIGCGAGREALGLARAGFRVTGIDVAPGMVAAARANAARAGLAIAFRVQDVVDLDEPPASYAGAYLGCTLHHVPGRARRVDALRRIRRALAPGGVLILAVLYRRPRPLLSRSRFVDALRRVGRWLPGGWRLSEPGDGWMRDVSEASDPREPIFFHDYAGPAEVRSELEEAGFAPAEVEPGWWVCRDHRPQR